LPNENDDESEEQKPEVHPDKSDQSALEVLAKAAKIAGQVTAIAGAFAAVLSLIGGIWIAAAAYIIPGGGEALSSASLTGLISLVALGGVWFLFIAVGTLGFSGYCYGTMFKGFDSVRHKETLLARRFLPELVLFAGNTIAVVIVYFVISRFRFGFQHFWQSTFLIVLICVPTIASAILHTTVGPDLKRSSLRSRLMRTLFATLTFAFPVFIGLALALTADTRMFSTSWLAISFWAFMVFYTNYLFAIGDSSVKLFAGLFALVTLLLVDSKTVITGPLRLYHLIDFKANLVAASASEDNVRHSLGSCSFVEKVPLTYAKHKFALSYNVNVLNSIGNSYVIKCGKQPNVLVSKASFAAVRW
jgi:hypothetical protein